MSRSVNYTAQYLIVLYHLQEYRATGLFGSSTDSYDSEGKKVRDTPYQHVTKEKIESILDRFRGEIKQLPPMLVLYHLLSPDLMG